ncbi:hypothetical protein EU563_21820, partial [Salmonella enterica]|nr:hypothetical protein [Salmonella enterica]ECC2206798.1 hypothetical protein [Salmonella enterica]
MKKTLIAMLVATTFAGNAVAAPTPSAYDSVQDGRIDAARMIADHANGQGANHEGRIQALEGNTAAQLNQLNNYVNSVNTNQTGVNAVQSGQITTNANAITANTTAIANNANAITTLNGTVQQQTGNFVQNADYAKDKAAQAAKDGDQDKLIKANGDASKTNTGDIAAIRNDLKQKADNGRVDSIQQMAQQNSVLAQDNAAKIKALPAGITQATYDAGQKAQDDKIADNGKKITAVDGNLTQLTWNVTDNKDSIDDLKKHKVDVKTFTDGQKVQDDALKTESDRAQKAEQANTAAIGTKVDQATYDAGQKAQDKRLTQVESDAFMTRVDLGDETSARKAADTKLQTGVDANKTAVAAETTRATAAEQANATAIATKVDQATYDAGQKAQDKRLTQVESDAFMTRIDLGDETSARKAADTKLQAGVDANKTAVAAETTRATGEEKRIEGLVSTNQQSITANQTALAGKVDTTTYDAGQKAQDKRLTQVESDAFMTRVDLGDETSARKAADTKLQTGVDANKKAVAANQQGITANTNALTSKVDTTTYAADQQAQNDTIDRHHQEIMGNTARLTADEAELHNDTSRITANESNIQANKTALQGKAAQWQVDNNTNKTLINQQEIDINRNAIGDNQTAIASETSRATNVE